MKFEFLGVPFKTKLKWSVICLLRACLARVKSCFRGEILVLGDSHAKAFRHSLFLKNFPAYFFNVMSVGGATASGLPNPNSKTQALSTLKHALKLSRAKTVVVMLGEVDVGFVIWHRAQKKCVSVDTMLDEALANYQSFLKEVRAVSGVICISAPLPTISESRNMGEVANVRRGISATQAQRTELTLAFNKRMQEFCQGAGLHYVSLDEASLGEDGLVAKHLLNPLQTDHHYDADAFARMLVESLQRETFF